MTNAALARRSDFPPLADVPHGLQGIANAATDARTSENPITTALAVIVTYIPTEILTLYVAVVVAIHNPKSIDVSDLWANFWIFLGATPIVVWAIYAGKVKSNRKPLPLAPAKWPWWEMIAATIAYVAWAVSLPNAPFLAAVGLPVNLASVIVLVASVALGLLAPIFQTPIQAGA